MSLYGDIAYFYPMFIFVVIIKTASCAEFFERTVEDPDFKTTSVKCTLFLM